jgi:hypothetical protein
MDYLVVESCVYPLIITCDNATLQTSSGNEHMYVVKGVPMKVWKFHACSAHCLLLIGCAIPILCLSLEFHTVLSNNRQIVRTKIKQVITRK